jgi:acetyl-CoA C-acetyltransferase
MDSSLSDSIPVLIGVGEASDRLGTSSYRGLSPLELAVEAARAALDDAKSVATLSPHVDTVVAIRAGITENSSPFGVPKNLPYSISRALSPACLPSRFILSAISGSSPQAHVTECAQAISCGRMGMVLIAGAEAMSTEKWLLSRRERRDWSDSSQDAAANSQPPPLDDRGGARPMPSLDDELVKHGVTHAIPLYALLENARRARLGLSPQEYTQKMGELFAPFSAVASRNPHAASQQRFSPSDLSTVTASNRLVSDPYPRRMVARAEVNQGAAVLLTSRGVARKLGVPEEKWVYLHGAADVHERDILQREDIGASPAAHMALKASLSMASLPDASPASVQFFDMYSCFPIAVFNALDGLGLSPSDPRQFTLTGGLPFFGGPGSNYSMHAIASMVRTLRAHPRSRGVVLANGGYLSHTSVGVYSTQAPQNSHVISSSEWSQRVDSSNRQIQRLIDASKFPAILNSDKAADAAWQGRVLTFTVDHLDSGSPRLLVIGERLSDGVRFVAISCSSMQLSAAEKQSLEAVLQNNRDPIDGVVSVRLDPSTRRCIIRSLTIREGFYC